MPDKLIQPFDHSAVAKLPEYDAASKALDALAHSLPRGTSRDRFLEMVREMTIALPYSDGKACGHDGYSAPYKATIKDEWISGQYRCGECGHEWPCGHSVTYIDNAF